MVNLGIIGLGDMGTKYAKMILKENIGFKIVAITRIKEERFNILKLLFKNVPTIYDSDASLFKAYDDKEIELDAILVVTPHYQHKTIIIEALKRNLYVLCDKPVGVKYSDMLELYNYDISKLGFIFQQRCFPSHKKLKEIIASNKYGEIKRFSYIVTDWYRPDSYYKKDKWRATYKTDGGGTIINQCPHNLDFLCDLFGLPTWVRSFNHYGRYHNIEVEDESTSYLEWNNKFNGVFITSTGETPGVNRLEISFSKAKICLYKDCIEIVENEYLESYYRSLAYQSYTIKSNTEAINFINDSRQAYLDVLFNFYDVVRGKAKFLVNLDEALKSLYSGNVIYLSSFINADINLDDKEYVCKVFEEEFGKRCI